MDIILSKHKWKNCLVHLDEITVFSKTLEEHFEYVEQIVKKFQDAGINLKIKKSTCFTKNLKYRGCRITRGSLEKEEV